MALSFDCRALLGGPGPQHIALGNFCKSGHPAAILGGEIPRRAFARKRHRLLGAHAAPYLAADDVERLLRVDPVLRSRLLPARRRAHVRYVDRGDVPGFLRQHRECDGVPSRGEPDGFGNVLQDDLALRPRMLEDVHAAVAPHRIRRKRIGGRHRRILLLLAAGKEKRCGEDCSDDRELHSSLLEKINVANPSGASVQSPRAASRTGDDRPVWSATPPRAERALAPPEPKLSRR